MTRSALTSGHSGRISPGTFSARRLTRPYSSRSKRRAALARQRLYKVPQVASASVAFTSVNAAGNCIVADITFTAGTYTAGPVTVTDSNGNTYSLAAGGPAPFQGTFLMTFVASNCAPGANTVTATMGGPFPFVEVTVDITEYLNVTGVVNASEYSDGGLFGTGNTVNVSVTPDTFCVMHLAVASGCVSIAIAGGARGSRGADANTRELLPLEAKGVRSRSV